METSRALGESESSTSLLSRDIALKDLPAARPQSSERPERSVVRGWPTTAKKLRDTAPSLPLRTFSRAFIALIPTSFIVLGISIACLKNKPKSSTSEVIVQAAKYAATFWPIAFAAVVGSMVRAIALYRAERGDKLRVLEMFMRSQTLFSTVKEILGLRIFSFWAAVLLAIWAFSPAGGIAVDRILRLRENFHIAQVPLVYFPNTNVSALTLNAYVQGGGKLKWSRSNMLTIYGGALSDPGAAVLTSNGSSANFDDVVRRISRPKAINGTRRDLWGNARIPFLRLVPDFDGNDPSKWISIPLDQVAPFASLIGMPIRGFSDSGIGNMTLELTSVYHVLNCSAWGNYSQWKIDHPDWISPSTAAQYGQSPNMFFKHLSGNDTSHVEPTIMFGARTSQHAGYYDNYTICGVHTEYVDVGIECSRLHFAEELDCMATRIREADTPPGASQITALGTGNWALQGFPEMTSLLASYDPNGLGPLEMYLRDPTRGLGPDVVQDFRGTPMPAFQTRLAMVFNTWWHITLNQTIFLGSDNVTPSTTNNTDDAWDGSMNEIFGWSRTSGNWRTPTDSTYKISARWMALYIAATTVLTLCAIVTIVLQSQIRAPDILGSVSTLTRDSPYVSAPPGGSGLESTERARLLKDMWVRIQDVRPGDDVGKIAFSDDKGLGARLKWDRLYE
ncbi:uncharacterized protein BKA78DRAFT_352105 [Phyllosticta capitalensis]|uniref:uncharacterized protein n=1 Tax=Phyllosticta capitalensis TaxID=121624 RepID=UPI00312F899E